jgi:hypothetical protein
VDKNNPDLRTAVDHCPRCGFDMPRPAAEDYCLAGTAMGGVWDTSVGGMTTGYFTGSTCLTCGAPLVGVEYRLFDIDQLLLSGDDRLMVWTDHGRAPSNPSNSNKQ